MASSTSGENHTSRTRGMRMLWCSDQVCGQDGGLLGRCPSGGLRARRAREAHRLAKGGQLHVRDSGENQACGACRARGEAGRSGGGACDAHKRRCASQAGAARDKEAWWAGPGQAEGSEAQKEKASAREARKSARSHERTARQENQCSFESRGGRRTVCAVWSLFFRRGVQRQRTNFLRSS